jgi:uncharacterized protein YacL
MTNMNASNKNPKKLLYTSLFFKILILVVSVIFLFFLYSLIISYGTNLLVIILIIVFGILVVIGPFLKKKKKPYYSQIFPEKKNHELDIKQRKELRKKKLKLGETDKQLPRIDIDFKYKKPPLLKCNNCGMTLPSFVEKCPICGKPLKD